MPRPTYELAANAQANYDGWQLAEKIGMAILRILLTAAITAMA